MTETAHIIARMEASTDPVEQARVQSKYPTDAVFRDVLALTYNPYEQFGTPWTWSPDLGPLPDRDGLEEDAINAALDEQWFTSIAPELRAGIGFEEACTVWIDSPAWPVIARVLAKRFEGVSFETVNGVWGTLPLFDAGDVSDDPPVFPCRAVPVPTRHRRLMVARPNAYAGGSPAAVRIDLFDRDGVCQAPVLSADFREALEWLNWRAVLERSPSGVVLDGFTNGDQDRFYAFDAVPLVAFQQQTLTESFKVRRTLIEPLDTGASELVMMLPAHLIRDADDWLVARADVPTLAGAWAVIAVDEAAPYPYRPTHAWRWLVRPGG